MSYDPRLPIPNPDLSGSLLAGVSLGRAWLDATEGQKRREEERRAQMQAAAMDQQRINIDVARTNEQIMNGRAERTDEWKQRATRVLQGGATPSALANLQRAIDGEAEKGRIEHFQLPGFAQAPELAGPQMRMERGDQEIADFGAMAGLQPDKPSEQKEIFQKAAVAYGFAPNDPAALSDARVQRLIRKSLEGSSGININVGGPQGKPLTAEATNTMADWSTVTGTLDDLFKSFTDRVPSDGVTGQVRAKGESYVPNSDVQSYLDEAGSAAQMIGVILEGGKLAEADFPRYLARMPQPGDSPERAQRKIEIIRREVERKLSARKDALGEQGFRVPGSGASAKPPTPSASGLTVSQKLAQVDALEKSGKLTKEQADQARAVARGAP